MEYVHWRRFKEIDKETNARIMDFVIARSVEGKDITGAGVMIGTPEYMSPD